MQRKIFFLLLIIAFMISCQTGKEDAKNFSKDYDLTINTLKEKRENVKTRDEYVAYQAEEKNNLEDLLKKYQQSPDIEEIEILRAKVLLDLNKLDEAEKKIEAVLADGPDMVTEAKMVKVNLLLLKEKFSEAYDIFKDIEGDVKDLEDLHYVYFYLSLKHKDDKIKKEYTSKFLNAKNPPKELNNNRYVLYSNLATVAAKNNDLKKAEKILKEGLAATKEERQKVILEKQLGQLGFIGKKAFPLVGDSWLNSDPVKIEKLKGKVVIVSFWAPWCTHCRAITPILVEQYNKYKDQGLMIVGLSRWYGRYEDDKVNKGEVKKEEETELIKSYLDRKKIPYPIVLTDKKEDYENYKITGLPTLVFIDKKGNFDFIQAGSAGKELIEGKIKALLSK